MATESDLSRYKKHDLRSHIYEIPGMWIGSVESTSLETFILNDESRMMEKKTITYVPGLLKIFEEALNNASDQSQRLKNDIKAGKADVKPVKNIWVTADKATGWISVMNDGDSIDVDIHPQYKVYIPTMIFGELLTSANYDQSEQRQGVAGAHGLGIKLTSVFSKELRVELVDHRRKKIFSQVFRDNLQVRDKPSIKSSSKAPYTSVSFLPDYERFGLTSLTDDIYDLIRRRTYDTCAVTDASVAVHFNGKKLEVKDFERYVDLFLGDKTSHPRVYEKVNDNWEIVATYSPAGSFEQMSWVNGVYTLAGKHIDYITGQITKALVEMAAKKKQTVKPNHVKDNLMIFVKCLIVNPSFSSQTKEVLTTAVSKFGSKGELSAKFMEKLFKIGLMDRAYSLSEFHEKKAQKKTDGKKTTRVLIPKLDDANLAGTKHSADCTLILTEGDSAKTMAIAGLSVIGRDRYGVFPLRGKVMNVKDTAAAKITANEEITNLKKILGLEQGKTYKDLSSLRYGKIMVLTDADHDGSHIKGLLFNLFQTLWPSLYKTEGFLTSMLTPIVRATPKSGGEARVFYNLTDFEKWRSTPGTTNGYALKYLKGLGSSSEIEAKEYFRKLMNVVYTYTGKESDDAIELAFNKKRADDRKAWLAKYDHDRVLDYNKKAVPYEEFVDKELIHFSNRDNERSIPSAVDGLKESIRKILFGCIKRKLWTSEIKVAQLAGYISEVSAYHHGEASLQNAIINMAQNFVGSNNVNLLHPSGQFGTRIQGGADAASPRYIFTLLTELSRLLFREEDAAILKNLDDDGTPIEPEWYIPIVPLVLVNGASGIGSGFSTDIPCFNPADVAGICMRLCETLDADIGNIHTKDDLSRAYDCVMSAPMADIHPWYLGFRGTIVKVKDGTYASKGVWRWIDDQTVEITELPIGTWTDKYKEFLVQMIAEGSSILKDFESHCTTLNVRFILKLFPGVRVGVEKTFETTFKLVGSGISLNNMHLYNAEGAITKYATVHDIIREWSCVRICKYVERKASQLARMEQDFKILAAKCRFIQDIIDDRIKIMNRKAADVHEQLRKLDYPTLREDDDTSAGYGYLTRMPIHHLTFEKKQALEKEAEKLDAAIKALRAKPIQHIWRDELREFAAAWDRHREAVDAEYEADLSGVVAHKKKRVARK
jgi:DNA topoisomerase-2